MKRYLSWVIDEYATDEPVEVVFDSITLADMNKYQELVAEMQEQAILWANKLLAEDGLKEFKEGETREDITTKHVGHFGFFQRWAQALVAMTKITIGGEELAVDDMN